MVSTSPIRLAVLDAGGQQILTCNENGEDIQVLRDQVENYPDGIFVDRANNAIYGTLMGTANLQEQSAFEDDGVIWRMALDGSNYQVIVGNGQIRTPKQITADLQAGKLYFTDREGMKVWRCNTDGSDLELLVETGKRPDNERDQRHWCVGIAVDPLNRQFYWTQKGHPDGGEGRIFRANYDRPTGEQANARSDIELLFDNLPEPIDLELDREHGWLWWTDRSHLAGGNSVCRAQLKPDGSIPQTHEVVIEHIGETIALAIYHEHGFIFSSSLTGELYRTEISSGKTTQIGKFKMLTGITKY